MELNTKIGLLRDEYLLIQKFYEDYDSRIITIKGWSATVGMVALGGGFYQSPYLWLVASGAALVFWFLEGLWKSFQYMYGPRIQQIEDAFRTESFDKIAPLQVWTSWFACFRGNGLGWRRNMMMGIVVFPHSITFVLGLALFFAEVSGMASFPRGK